MKLLSWGVGVVAALGLTALAFAARPVLPTCGAEVVKEVVNTDVSQSAPHLIVSGLDDVGGEMRDGLWHCTATLSTDRGPIPIKYSVGLFGPGKLQVSMAAALPR